MSAAAYRTPYDIDRAYADQYADQQLAIFQSVAVHTSTFVRDTKFASDFMVWRVKFGPRAGQPLGDVAARVRRPGNFWGISPRGRVHWGLQFTIRSKRDSGVETELSKISKGWADWFGYGHVEQTTIRHWTVLDLEIFRMHKDKPYVLPEIKDNRDGTYFQAYDIRAFPPEFVVAASPTMHIALEHGVNAVDPLPAITSPTIEERPPPRPPDLATFVAQFGGYGYVSAEGWAEWDRLNEDFKERRGDYYKGLHVP